MALPLLFQPYPQHLRKEELSNPFKVINDFFSDHYMDEAKDLINKWIKFSNRKQQWRETSPSFLLSYYEQICGIIEASWIIQQIDSAERLADLSPLNLGVAELCQSDFYCSHRFRKNHWDDFPRTLKWKEYINPYIALSKFFRYQGLAEWKRDIHSLLHLALSKCKMDGGEVDLLNVSMHLNKLIEACHLVHVREFEWIDSEMAFKEIKQIEKNRRPKL
ncbi:hypothetical protein [Chitinophaga defluvii]|uniref:Uncharacterized protein n=1 Tax=Chitinophaga defluvii TaxID=3163343 RepID=A0ABV2T9V6_9BACT